MDTVILTRLVEDDQGTEGILCFGDTSCYTFELPWKDNCRNISCIPAGTYTLVRRRSPKFGNVYLVQNVPDRSSILIHAGNFAGDESKGYRSDTDGCILLGSEFGIIHKQKAILYSKITLKRFINVVAYKKAFLTIIDLTRRNKSENTTSI